MVLCPAEGESIDGRCLLKGPLRERDFKVNKDLIFAHADTTFSTPLLIALERVHFANGTGRATKKQRN